MAEREFRLAALVSLGWQLAILPWVLLSYDFMSKHPKYQAAISVALILLIAYKLLHVSPLFRRRDAISAAFLGLSAYCVAFVAVLLWLWLFPPRNAVAVAAACALFVMATAFLTVGLLLALAPSIAIRINELANGKVRLGQQSATQSRFAAKRLAGVFLVGVGALVMWLTLQLAQEALH